MMTEEATHKQKEKCFLLVLTGQIDTVEFASFSNIYCKYFYVYGPDWRQVGGEEEGITHIGYKREGGRITLNTSIEGSFCSTNPFKWPQIVFSFYGYDFLGNDVIRGYSVTHLPTVPGSVKRKCPIFFPQSSTAVQRLLSLFTGRKAEFVDPKIIAMAEGRDVTRVTTHGFVLLSLSATLRGMNKLGYASNSETISKGIEFPIPCQSAENTTITNRKAATNAEKGVKKENSMEPVQERQEETSWMEQIQKETIGQKDFLNDQSKQMQ